MNYSSLLLLTIPILALGESYIPRAETDPTPRWPYYTSIFIDDLAGSAWFCAGALISDTLVLTAASCVQEGAFYDITLGDQQFSSYEAIVHPDYDPATLAANIAVIRLPEAAQVEPAPLPSVG